MTWLGPPLVTRCIPFWWLFRNRSGMISSRGWPITSSSVWPNSAVAALFHDRTLPWASLEMMASMADSITERNFASDSRRAVLTLETVTCRSTRARTSRVSKGLATRSSPSSSPLRRISTSSPEAMKIIGIPRV